jgi:hypothetical protein
VIKIRSVNRSWFIFEVPDNELLDLVPSILCTSFRARSRSLPTQLGHQMSQANRPTEQCSGKCEQAEDGLRESQKACAELASEFGDFASECGAQIWSIMTIVETFAARALPPDVVSSEQLICLDVLNICSAFSRAGGIPDGFAAIFCAVVARVDPTRFKPEVMKDPAAEGLVSDWLANRVMKVCPRPLSCNSWLCMTK